MADQGAKADLLWSSDLMLGLLGPVRLVSSAGDDVTPKARKTRALLALKAFRSARKEADVVTVRVDPVDGW